MLIRLAGLIQLGLGLTFWSGNALNLIPIHMLVGSILVLAFWVLALLAGRMGVNRVAVAVAIVWGLIVPVLGITQMQLLPGELHWIIEVIHLLVGLIAIGLSERLATMSRRGHRRTLAA
jgi:hypothetical protein